MLDPLSVGLNSAAGFKAGLERRVRTRYPQDRSVYKGALMSVVSRGHLVHAFVSLALTSLLTGAVLFWSAGTLRWAHGLCLMATSLLLTPLAMAWLWRANPEIFFARRRLTRQGTKGWDLIFLFILFVSFLATLGGVNE
jgi:hypothetical protein